MSFEEIKRNIDHLQGVYEDISKEQNINLQQELRVKRLE